MIYVTRSYILKYLVVAGVAMIFVMNRILNKAVQSEKIS